jgi:hypothetical protein
VTPALCMVVTAGFDLNTDVGPFLLACVDGRVKPGYDGCGYGADGRAAGTRRATAIGTNQPTSSWPDLIRLSTPRVQHQCASTENGRTQFPADGRRRWPCVGGRVKPGHDGYGYGADWCAAGNRRATAIGTNQPTSSWPDLIRLFTPPVQHRCASTEHGRTQFPTDGRRRWPRVDGRVKAGHDGCGYGADGRAVGTRRATAIGTNQPTSSWPGLTRLSTPPVQHRCVSTEHGRTQFPADGRRRRPCMGGRVKPSHDMHTGRLDENRTGHARTSSGDDHGTARHQGPPA